MKLGRLGEVERQNQSTGLSQAKDNVMYQVYLLAHNIDSRNDSVRLSGFEMSRASARSIAEFRELFRTHEVYNDDWVLHREYADLPPAGGPDPCQCGRIPFDVEDLLLTLRLFRSGDITFSRFMIRRPDHTSSLQAPYRVISEANSDSPLRYYIEEEDGVRYDRFSQEMWPAQHGTPLGLASPAAFSFTAVPKSSSRGGMKSTELWTT